MSTLPARTIYARVELFVGPSNIPSAEEHVQIDATSHRAVAKQLLLVYQRAKALTHSPAIRTVRVEVVRA